MIKNPLPAVTALGLLSASLFVAVATAPESAPAQTTASEHVVTMTSMRYGRIPTGLKVGDTITWVNRDSVPHTITARNKSFDLRVNAGKSAKMKLTKAGATPFYCILHPGMRGTLNVGS